MAKLLSIPTFTREFQRFKKLQLLLRMNYYFYFVDHGLLVVTDFVSKTVCTLSCIFHCIQVMKLLITGKLKKESAK